MLLSELESDIYLVSSFKFLSSSNQLAGRIQYDCETKLLILQEDVRRRRAACLHQGLAGGVPQEGNQPCRVGHQPCRVDHQPCTVGHQD
jgi:hypothetical protein